MDKDKDKDKEDDNECIIPLSAISHAKQILKLHEQKLQVQSAASAKNSTSKQSEHLLMLTKLNNELENNIKQGCKLSFTSQPSSSSSSSNSKYKEMTPEQKIKYDERIQKLKLSVEERKYSKLTSNLDKTPDDDATLSSMLYASSVGMNMIVAPISIGVLMYFFAGKLMSWIFGSDSDNPSSVNSLHGTKDGKLNIHGVIVGVLSGVIMLFIEMILFVIRNHEMDRHLSNKKKKSRKNPFGYDKKTAERTFTG